MKRAVLIFSFLLALTLAAAALPPRTAVVRITDIYRDLDSTAKLQERAGDARQAMLSDERAEVLRTALRELEALDAEIRENQRMNSPDAMRELDVKRREVLTLQEEFERFRREEEQRINREMVDSMNLLLARIAGVAAQLASERGFDVLLDSSGNSNTGVPVLIHAKNATDITSDVMTALRDIHGELSAEEARAAEEVRAAEEARAAAEAAETATPPDAEP